MSGLRFWIALLLMGVTIVSYLDRTCLSVAGPVLKRERAIDEREFANIIVAFQFAYMIMQPVAGRIIDWIGLRAGLALSIGWWSIAQVATALAGGWRSFAALRALLGVGEAGNFPGAAKGVSQWFPPRERTLATGIFNVGAGLGQAFAAPLVAWLILRYDWQTAFAATGAVGLAWVAVWLALYRPPERHPWLSPGELAFIRAGQRELVAVREAPEGRSVWKAVLRERNFWSIAVARFLSEPAWQLFSYWIPFYLATERHMNLKEIGASAWVPFVAGDVGCLVGGLLSPLYLRLGVGGRRRGEASAVIVARKLSATTCAVVMVFAVFIGGAPSAAWAIALFSVGAFAHQAMSSTLLTLPADVFPERTVATANGLSGTAAMLGGLLFTKLVGQLVTRIGYGPLFVAIGLFDLVGSTLLWWLLRAPAPGEGAAAAAREEAAVDREDLAVDEARRLRREEHRGPRQLLDPAEALHGRPEEELAPAGRPVEERLVERRAEDAGRDRVDAHAARAPLERQRLRERRHRRLARPVGGHLVEGDRRGE